MNGDEISITESETTNEDIEFEIHKAKSKIDMIQQKIDEYDRLGNELRILFRCYRNKSLGFFENIFNKKVNLFLFIKIKNNWMNNINELNHLGQN